MHLSAAKSSLLYLVAGITALALLAGCSTPKRISDERLQALGIRVGAMYWQATSQLMQEGYVCMVTGAKRENFDCTKKAGGILTCILRVRLIVDDQNKISSLSVPEPACIGTP